MRSDPKRTAKAGRKKQSISGQRQRREKKGAGGAETGAAASSIPVSQISHKKPPIITDWLKTECDFRDLATEQLEWCCKYEYLRESKGLREGLANPKRGAPVVSRVDWMDNARLVFALIKAGYPAPWNKLDVKSKADLAQVLSWNSKNQERHPVFMAQEFEPVHDPDERDRLVEQWKESAYYDAAAPDRNYFFGLFRLDETYNETDAVKAFGTWFSERRERTKSGGSPHWQAKLNDLVVMRLWKRFPGDPIKRVQHVAELTTAGFRGCKKWADERREAIKAKLGLVDQRMSKAASEEMSRARADALKFFQSLFPGEKPLSF